MAEAQTSKKRQRGNPNQTTGLIGVYKSGEKYRVLVRYGGTQHSLGTFDTKEQAGVAYDQFVVDKSSEEVSFTLNYKHERSRKRGSIESRTTSSRETWYSQSEDWLDRSEREWEEVQGNDLVWWQTT